MIEFKGDVFHTRSLVFEGNDVLLSTISLNDKLLDSNGKYVSDDAERIDNDIFYFVEENEIELSDKDLHELLNIQVR